MNKKAVTTLAVCVLLLTAGCGGLLSSQSEPQETSTQTPSNTQQNETGFPPGVSEQGIENGSLLLSNHQSSLGNTSYRIRFGLTRATPQSFVNTSTVIQSNLSEQRLYTDSDLPNRRLSRYYNQGRVTTWKVIRNTTEVSTQQTSGSFQRVHTREARPGQLLNSIVSVSEIELNRTEERRGKQVAVYDVVNVSAPSSNRYPNTIEYANGTVAVGQDGIIYEASLFVAGETDGRQEILFREYETEATSDIDITEPRWAAET
jgi:hypothetical protein